MKNEILIYVHVPSRERPDELEVPGDITAIDLIEALASIYRVPVDKERVYDYYLKMDRPKALVRGNQKLSDTGMRNGSEVWFWNE